MTTFLKKLPYILVYSRVFFAIVIALLALTDFAQARVWIVIGMSIGLLTDIFDGIIARRLNISTQQLRVLDSNVDQFFWIVTIASIFYMNQAFISANYVWILVVVILEFITYALSFLKFKKSIATHSILAKIWSLSLLIFLIDLCLNKGSFIPFISCISLGILSRIEIALIILKLQSWTTDVPSVFSVGKINRGEPVWKNKLFNG